MNNKNPAVVVDHVFKRFGGEEALRDVSLRLAQGAIHGIVGRNGSGKTVLMKCICGFLRPTAGTITVFGKRIGRDTDFAQHTGMLIESPGFLPHETGLSNLLWLDRLAKRPVGKEKVCQLIERVGLDPSLKKSVNHYSLGMRQRLGIAQALLGAPKLLILDEPMNGLDQAGVQDVRGLLLSLKRQGVSILLASHYPQDVQELCDTVSQMDRGMLA